MIYIFTALYAEAKPMIKSLGLKEIKTRYNFKQYFSKGLEDSEICLTITGVGSVAASTAVGAVCAYMGVKATDFLINIGTCAGDLSKKQEAFLINKLTEKVTGRTFYPDVLYRHMFEETELVTVPAVVKDGMDKVEQLYDMEAAAIYQAGSFFAGPHQMYFIKVVSDSGEETEMISSALTDCVEMHMEKIIAFIRRLEEISQEQLIEAEVFSEEEWKWINHLCEDLKCSVTMQAMVKQLCRYCKLAGIDYMEPVCDLYGQGILPCKDKREGKRLFDEITRQLL